MMTAVMTMGHMTTVRARRRGEPGAPRGERGSPEAGDHDPGTDPGFHGRHATTRRAGLVPSPNGGDR
jgi:hypothetical protein